MTYAKRILPVLLIFCVLLNLSTAVFAGDNDELPPSETAVEETTLEESAPTDEEASSAETMPDEDATLPETTAPPEGEEETTEPPTEEVPAEETIVTEEEPTAEITAVSDTVMPMASGVEIVHCGNAILTDAVGTLSFEYYSYLDGAKKTAHTGKRAAENQGAADQAPKGKSCPGCRR